MKYEKTLIVNSDDFKEIEKKWCYPDMNMYFPVCFNDQFVMNVGLIGEGYYYGISEKFACLCEKTCEKHGKIMYVNRSVNTEQVGTNTIDLQIIYGKYEIKYHNDIYIVNVIEGKHEAELAYRYTYEYSEEEEFGSNYIHEYILESDTKRDREKAQAEEKAFFEDRTWMLKEDCLTFDMGNLLKNINL